MPDPKDVPPLPKNLDENECESCGLARYVHTDLGEARCAYRLMAKRAWPECTCGGGNEIGSHLAKCAITDHKGHLAARTAGPGDQEKKT